MKKNIIKFIPVDDISFFEPIPASKFIPDWYKNAEGYVGGKKAKVKDSPIGKPTIKKCMPVFDSMTAGYIMFTQVDISFSDEMEYDPFGNEIGNVKYWHYASSSDFTKPVTAHDAHQLPDYPGFDDSLGGAGKFEQPFAIKTPKGYSCLFMNPVHRDAQPFEILEGIVDTDLYHGPINFPFIFKDNRYTGIIPAGTPIAQVIPFKRESWTMDVDKTGIEEVLMQNKKLHTVWWEGYKRWWWTRKEFR
jgi:hypothetical protein